MRQRALAVLLGALLLLVAGCSQVPASTTPVVVGNAPDGPSGDQSNYYEIQPDGPVKGDSPDTIVRGYINALATSDPTYEVARQFMTTKASKEWQPGASTSLIDPAYSVQPSGKDGVVNFSASRSATVDSDGTYHAGAESMTDVYKLEKVAGQWRISNPPDGIVLTQSSFSNVFKVASLYFLDPSGTRVVPDLRYYPVNPKQRANTLIDGLLGGPSDSLAPGVRNEVSDPVKLRSGVLYNDSEIKVDLTGLSGKNGAQLKALSAQILWTLRDLNVKAVRITNDGQPIDVPGVAAVQSVSDWESYDPDAVPVDLSVFYVADGRVLNGQGAAVAGNAGTGALGVTSASLSVDGTEMAAVGTATGVPTLYVGPAGSDLVPVALPDTVSLTQPTWGAANDEVWMVRNGNTIVRVPTKGQPAIVTPGSLGDISSISSLRLSRDGTRVAMVATVPSGSRLFLATVVRSPDGVTITEPMMLSPTVEVTETAWSTARTLVVFGRGPVGTRDVPYSILIDDSSRTQLPAPVFTARPTAIVAAPNRSLVCAGDGIILKLTESTWVSLISGKVVSGKSPFYPG
ncbi:LpqB family beta-propeller domain-containing protein [Antricoccus suffuscus]|nr:LpqB family beta-propeller domain-containing protein [Antricoccus suffuscus]